MLRITLLFISLFIFPFASYSQDKPESKQQETITIVADTWCPFNCTPTSPHPGFMIDLVTAAFAKHNIKVEYSIVPWTRAIEETRKGLHTAIIGAAVDDAPDFIFPNVAEGFVKNHFFVKKGNPWRYTTIDSLKGVVLGLIADYSYTEEMDNYIKKYKLDPQRIEMMSGDKALAINVSKLLRGKIGAVVESKYVMTYYLSQNGLQDQVENAGALTITDKNKLYVAFSPKNKKLAQKYADIISEEIPKMRASGELAKILDIYGIIDWEQQQ